MHGRDIGGRYDVGPQVRHHRYILRPVDLGKEDAPAHVPDPNLGRISAEIKVPVLINLSICVNK